MPRDFSELRMPEGKWWTASLRGVLRFRTVLFLFVLFILAGAVVMWNMVRLASDLVESTALEDARSYVGAFDSFLAHHASREPLSQVIAGIAADEQHGGLEVRFLNKERLTVTGEDRDLDHFERQALAAVAENPSKPYYRVEPDGERPALRYVTAHLAAESCVRCHNDKTVHSIPAWEVGELLGAVEVIRPLDSVGAMTRERLYSTAILLSIVGIAALAGIAMVGARLKRETEMTQQLNRRMYITNEELTLQANELNQALHDLHRQRESTMLSKLEVEETRDALQLNSEKLDEARRAALNMMEDMEHAMAKAEAANLAKSEFLANMSHEIRTPMTAILGYVELLTDRTMGEQEFQSCVETIRRNGLHLLTIINDILDLSKLESGKLTVERIDCNPAQVVADVASLMRVRAEGRGLELEVEYASAIPVSIKTDPTRLRQILLNLVGNAVKFTEKGAVRVAVSCTENASQEGIMRFVIADSGIGMNSDEVDRLFRAFTQADTTTTRRFGGTGLGLIISKRFAELLGGDIEVESRLGEGSTFTVTISTGSISDVAMAQNPLESHAEHPEADSKPELDPSVTGRVLLAEDGPDNQRLISFFLRKSGFEVTVVDNGLAAYETALEAAREGEPYDAILMDMQMPVMDGYTATSRLRENDYDGPIIALTAHAMTSDRDKCLAAGCDEFQSKPINRGALIRTIQEQIQRARERAEMAG